MKLPVVSGSDASGTPSRRTDASPFPTTRNLPKGLLER
jgi:hypothetical protein